MKAINETIKFLTKNFINENCQLDNLDSNVFNIKKICDFSPYKENNIISNTTNLNFRIWFKDIYGQFISRKINTIILQNCNIKNMLIKTIVNNQETTLFTLSDNQEKDLEIVLVNEYELNQIIFEIIDVFDNDLSVKIGQIRCCNFICNFSATTETEVQPIVDEGSIRTYDGSLVYWLNYEKWGARISAKNIKKEQYFKLKKELKDEGYLTIIPWKSWNIKDIYEVKISAKSFGTYSVNRWSGLISITLTLEAQENANN